MSVHDGIPIKPKSPELSPRLQRFTFFAGHSRYTNPTALGRLVVLLQNDETLFDDDHLLNRMCVAWLGPTNGQLTFDLFKRNERKTIISSTSKSLHGT